MKLTPLVGFVGAGKNVVQFPLETRGILVPLPHHNHKSFKVSGDSLENPDDPHESVLDGDYINVETINNVGEVKCNSICVVRILSQDSLFAKMVCVHGDKVVMKSVNPKYDEFSCDIDDVEIIGVMVGHYRPRRK